MKKFIQWTGILLGGLFVLVAIAGLVLYPIGMKKLSHTYPNIAVETIDIPTDADAVAHGKHIATIWARCHGRIWQISFCSLYRMSWQWNWQCGEKLEAGGIYPHFQDRHTVGWETIRSHDVIIHLP